MLCRGLFMRLVNLAWKKCFFKPFLTFAKDSFIYVGLQKKSRCRMKRSLYASIIPQKGQSFLKNNLSNFQRGGRPTAQVGGLVNVRWTSGAEKKMFLVLLCRTGIESSIPRLTNGITFSLADKDKVLTLKVSRVHSSLSLNFVTIVTAQLIFRFWALITFFSHL